MEKVLIPLENKEDWDELDKDIRSSIGAEFVENAEDAFRIIFKESLYRGSKRNAKTAKRALARR
jgi:ATP-dependent Lon protease